MDEVTHVLRNVQEHLLMHAFPYGFAMEMSLGFWATAATGILTLVLIFYYTCRPKLPKVKLKIRVPSITVGSQKPRFRKRDKVIFYGRKMLRRVRSFARNSINPPPGRRSASSRKKQFIRLARKLLHFKKEQQPRLKVREPPPQFLEADWLELERSEQRLPTEVLYLLRSVRVLGHFERPIFLELCRFMESRFIPSGTYLFRVGDPDDSIYVVQNGKVNMYIADQEGKEHHVKEVNKGDCIHSLLSILDVLTGHKAPYKTVSAIAAVDSTVIRLPAQAFQIVLESYPESLVRVVQIIMVRLQRVTFMALHNYLGLTYELMNPEDQSDKSFSVHSIGTTSDGSPTKLVVRESRSVSTVNSSEGETVTKVTNYEEDTGNSNKSSTDTHEVKKKRRSSEPMGCLTKASTVNATKSLSGSEVLSQPSDFDAACSRARVDMVLEDDPLVSGSPPVKMNLEDLWPKDPQTSSSNLSLPSSRRSNKRAVLTDNVSIIPSPPTSRSWPTQKEDSLSDDDIRDMALQDLVKMFGLEDESLLQGRSFLRYIRAGTTLVKQGDQECNMYFVVTGQLQVQQQTVGNESEERTLFVVYRGDLVGSLAVLTGEPSFFTIRSLTDTRVIYISKHDFYAIMKEQPRIVLNVGHTVVRRLSRFVRQIDFALDWMLIEAGRALFRQGEQSDCLYIILNGRLRSVVTLPTSKKELVAEYGRGELVGIVEVLTQTERATTVMAVRDTELAQIPQELLNLIKKIYPQIVTRLIHLLGKKILGTMTEKPTVRALLSENHLSEPHPTVANLATVAVLAVSEEVPVSYFTLEVQHAVNGIGPTLRLTSEIIQNRLGTAALDSVNEYRLSSWLNQQEEINRMVLYQCDYRMTPWTQRCIRQADCILIVALADQEPTVGQAEKQLENLAVRAQKELILLHREDGPHPRRTVEWLNMRAWCSSHHHIRCPNRVFSRRSRTKMMDMYRKLLEKEPDRMSDFSRLARCLTGTAIGLVLGGGGARGLAHIGMIKAMQESGIPIDYIGGNSIGSLMGAIWADELDVTRARQRAREWAIDMASLWKKIPDLTYPVTAMFTGASFNHSIQSVLKERQIEDLWIPYFCITTDITASKMRIHTNGSCWRYVRASMSLSGYLPPLCDPVDGHLLLDGGYVNNLPADVMKAIGARTIFAVDVGSQDNWSITNYGDQLSGWWVLWKKWNPWASPVRIPGMEEIQSRLAFVSCERQLESVKNSDYCEYIRPPIDKYQTLQFASFDEIFDVGYNHGRTLFSTWKKKDLIRELFVEGSKEKVKPMLQKSTMPAEANFTDLAELVSRIEEPRIASYPQFFVGDGLSEEEDEDEEDEEEELLSVASEPPVGSGTRIRTRARPHSEGGSVSGTPDAEDVPNLGEEDVVDSDMSDLDVTEEEFFATYNSSSDFSKLIQ